MYSRALLLALFSGTSLTPLHAQDPGPAPAQAEPPADAESAGQEEEYEEDLDQEIVVTGGRPRGSVLGDIPPEVTLGRREIRAYGAGNLAELIDALAPQTRSGRGRGGGGGPVVLLNGRRISGFREIRDIPPEAVERVEVLPEEVALQYGYRAEQRVVNIVLRRRFRAVTTEVEGGLATAGGRESYGGEANLLRIGPSGRWGVDLDYAHSGSLLESERNLIQADPETARFRTLLPETDRLELEGTLNRFVFGDVSATINGGLEFRENRSLLGLPRDAEDAGVPLLRESDNRTGHLGLSMNGDIQPWRWNVTANYDNSRTVTRTERGVEEADLARSTAQSADAQAVFNGPVVQLPAGQLSASVRIGADTRSLDSRNIRSGIVQERDLSRDRAAAQASFDIPIASRRRDVLDAIGDLSANFNFEVEELSDFGTLTTVGAGARWEPVEQVDLAVSVTEEDGAPTIQQLGDPVLLTPNVRVFDFTRGETADVNVLNGGNPELLADSRRVVNLRATVRPLSETDLTFVGEFTRTRIRDPIASFPAATAEIEAAFPDRFIRDGEGRLVQIDSRPVNFARSDTEELRWGFNFSKPIGPQGPTPEQRREWRERARQRGVEGGGPGAGGGAAGQGRRGGGRGFGGGGGGFGRFGGGGGGGRVQLALYHTWRFTDSILIRPGVPELDLLGGSAIGNRGGRPRHQIELDGGLFLRGFGARLTGTWQSGTTVQGLADQSGGTRGDLRFGDFASFNLRLFADLNQQRALIRRHPFLRGARVSLSIDNIFDSRLDVRDETGATPLSYQPAYLDPLGRTVRLTIRKQFFSRPNRAGFGRVR